MRFQSDMPGGASPEVDACWRFSGTGGSISVSSGPVGVVLGLNQLVIGLVPSGGSFPLGRLLDLRGVGVGARRMCEEGCSPTLVSVHVLVSTLCVFSVAVFMCLGGWSFRLFSGG